MRKRSMMFAQRDPVGSRRYTQPGYTRGAAWCEESVDVPFFLDQQDFSLDFQRLLPDRARLFFLPPGTVHLDGCQRLPVPLHVQYVRHPDVRPGMDPTFLFATVRTVDVLCVSTSP